jgi:hypothetical protein
MKDEIKATEGALEVRTPIVLICFKKISNKW